MSESKGLNPLLLKFLVVAALVLTLLVPLFRVESLIRERIQLRDHAVERVAAGVGGIQSVGAMMLVVPESRLRSSGGRNEWQTIEHRMLADSVEVQGSADSVLRHSGIYQVPAFRAKLHISGQIEGWPADLGPGESNGDTKVGRASLFLSLSDPGGIRQLEGVRVNGTLLPVMAATVNGLRGVAAEVPDSLIGSGAHISFTVDLVLSGTQRLEFLPFAASTHVKLESPWPSPSFSGSFSPDGAPAVTARGFNAEWRVLKINRDYPQRWVDAAVSPQQLLKSAFGVDFYQPVDMYQQNYRAIHYAVLFIALTFMALFLWEHLRGFRIHAIQYAMTGAALAVFYLVLLALSEHLGFAASYFAASAALTGLLGVYFAGVRQSRGAGFATGAVAAICYSLLYLLVLSEEYALLLGAFAVFSLLAGIMIGTRALDWYRISDPGRERG